MSENSAPSTSTAADVAAPDPLCFVLMPFGRKSDPTGVTIDFDVVYEQLIAPAIRAAELEPIRADEEVAGGIVHKPMFERLILCEYAVADLTFANANVFYELGVRHAVRPYSTVLVFASGTQLPFDVQLDRGLPYSLDPHGRPVQLDAACAQLTERLVAARESSVDSPVFQLVEGFPEIDRLKTDVFRDQVRYSVAWKERLARARKEGLEAVRVAEQELGDLLDVEAGIVVDLYLSYRAVKGYEEMVSLVERMPRPLAKTPLVREQLGLALNRLGRPTPGGTGTRHPVARRGRPPRQPAVAAGAVPERLGGGAAGGGALPGVLRRGEPPAGDHPPRSGRIGRGAPAERRVAALRRPGRLQCRRQGDRSRPRR